jgi:hypothetical protein
MDFLRTHSGSLVDSFRITFTHLSSFVVNVGVVVVVSPNFIVPAFIIVATYYYYAALFIKTSRDLRRLESNARSPIFSKFGETLHGIVSCRAFGAERRFVAELYKSVDTMSAVAYSSVRFFLSLSLSLFFLLALSFLSISHFPPRTDTYLPLRPSPTGSSFSASTSSEPSPSASPPFSPLLRTFPLDWQPSRSRPVKVSFSRSTGHLASSRNSKSTSTPSSASSNSSTLRKNRRRSFLTSARPRTGPLPSADFPSRTSRSPTPRLSRRSCMGLPSTSRRERKLGWLGGLGAVNRRWRRRFFASLSLLRARSCAFSLPFPSSFAIGANSSCASIDSLRSIDGIDVTQIGLNDLRRAVTLIPQEAGSFSSLFLFLSLVLPVLTFPPRIRIGSPLLWHCPLQPRPLQQLHRCRLPRSPRARRAHQHINRSHLSRRHSRRLRRSFALRVARPRCCCGRGRAWRWKASRPGSGGGTSRSCVDDSWLGQLEYEGRTGGGGGVEWQA